MTFLKKWSILCIGLSLLVALVASTSPLQAKTSFEAIYNGEFEIFRDGWTITGTGLTIPSASYGRNGRGIRQAPRVFQEVATAVQELNLPETIDSVTIQVDYRINNLTRSDAIYELRIESDDGLLASRVVATGEDNIMNAPWRTETWVLPPSVVNAIEAAHAAEKGVYFFTETTDSVSEITRNSEVDVDNVSITVDGTWDQSLSGDVVYLGASDDGQQLAIRTLSAASGTANELFVMPEGFDDIYALDVSPDGSEIAFSSNGDVIYSPYLIDAFAIDANGGGLRKVSNPPLHADLAAPTNTGTVTGKIRNDFNGTVFSSGLILYIPGSAEFISTGPLGSMGNEINFTIPNVPEGVIPALYNTWTSSIGLCKDAIPIAGTVQRNQTVNVGTLSFSGGCSNSNFAPEVSWRSDGAELAMIQTSGGQILQFAAGGENFGRNERTPINLTTPIFDILYSPTSEQMLINGSSGTRNETLLSNNENDPGSVIFFNDDIDPSYDWLPNGNGVVTADEDAIFLSPDLSAISRLRTFTDENLRGLAVSPDGQHAVFVRAPSPLADDNIPATLWVIDLDNPTNWWQLSDRPILTFDPDLAWATLSSTPTAVNIGSAQTLNASTLTVVGATVLLVALLIVSYASYLYRRTN